MKNTISILIVDDEEVLRSLLEKILSREGYQIKCAEDGVTALEILREEPYDIVISDMQMPRMDGFELLRTIKSEFPNIGIIIMTGFGDSYTVKDALLLGADEYITKPFRSYEISLIVERAYWRMLSNKDQSTTEVS
ncbi:MAG: response regulator [candidate division Zixibacteria bacterium]|nr:response regulator [candidate division Zixibacteria bacterium]